MVASCSSIRRCALRNSLSNIAFTASWRTEFPAEVLKKFKNFSENGRAVTRTESADIPSVGCACTATPLRNEFIAKLHEATCRETIAAGEIEHPHARDSAICVGRLRFHSLPQIGDCPSQERLVGGLIDQQRYAVQRHLIDEGTKFENRTLPCGCKSTQVHCHQIALRHQFCYRLLPRVVAAEEFVDTVTSVRVRPKVEPRNTPVEIGVAANVGAG